MITNMSALVHRRIRFAYALPALSCSMNGSYRRSSGWVTHIENDHPDFGRAFVVDGIYIAADEVMAARIKKRWVPVRVI